MKKELDEKLVRDFPNIFRDRYEDMSKTCMCWGFSCGDGWYPLIREICEEMDRIRKETGVQYIATQVKEKYGGLRFYYSDTGNLAKITKEERNNIWRNLSTFVSRVEVEAERTCEECGKPGKLRGSGWMVTLCDKCDKQRNK